MGYNIDIENKTAGKTAEEKTMKPKYLTIEREKFLELLERFHENKYGLYSYLIGFLGITDEELKKLNFTEYLD